MLGGGAIADGETDAKNASVDGPLELLWANRFIFKHKSFHLTRSKSAEREPLQFRLWQIIF
jgi:hypothetical protein